MPRKKSIKKAAVEFRANVSDIRGFLAAVAEDASEAHTSRIYDAAIIGLYRDFESLILEVLVGAINNDTQTISDTLGVEFPKHLTDEVCYYLVTGPSYFDFKGRSGLIRRVKQYVPDTHYCVGVLKKSSYRHAIDRLCALRNHATHKSPQSKRAALDAIGQKKMGTAGSWLKKQNRFDSIANKLDALASDLENEAPY